MLWGVAICSLVELDKFAFQCRRTKFALEIITARKEGSSEKLGDFQVLSWRGEAIQNFSRSRVLEELNYGDGEEMTALGNLGRGSHIQDKEKGNLSCVLWSKVSKIIHVIKKFLKFQSFLKLCGLKSL